MAKQIGNHNASEYIARQIPFTSFTGSLWAEQDGNAYRIHSYSTLMAEIVSGEITYLNEQRYSVTTSKHQSIIRRGLDGLPLSKDATLLAR